jgi:hydrogenase nickel incorporation protein HypA/HybF
MHELTLAEHAMGIVEAAARKAEAKRVTRIRLSIGVLAHVDPDTMQYCCEVVSRGSLAEGAQIEVERAPGLAWCGTCNAEVALKQVGEPCPQCGGYQLKITDGDQMQVVDISIE